MNSPTEVSGKKFRKGPVQDRTRGWPCQRTPKLEVKPGLRFSPVKSAESCSTPAPAGPAGGRLAGGRRVSDFCLVHNRKRNAANSIRRSSSPFYSRPPKDFLWEKSAR